MKIEFEDGLLNFKIFFSTAEKVLKVLIFKCKLFLSMTVDGKKEFKKKLYLPLKREILSLLLVLYVVLTLGSILERYSGD